MRICGWIWCPPYMRAAALCSIHSFLHASFCLYCSADMCLLLLLWYILWRRHPAAAAVAEAAVAARRASLQQYSNFTTVWLWTPDNFSQGVLVLYNHSRIRRRCLPATYMPLNEKGRRKNFQNRQINNITTLVDDGQIFCRKIILKVIELPSGKCAVTSTRKSLTLIGELTE